MGPNLTGEANSHKLWSDAFEFQRPVRLRIGNARFGRRPPSKTRLKGGAYASYLGTSGIACASAGADRSRAWRRLASIPARLNPLGNEQRFTPISPQRAMDLENGRNGRASPALP